MAQPFLGYPIISVTGVNITTSGVSASATIPLDSSGVTPRYVRVASSAGAYVRFGKTSATAVNTDCLVQPGDATILAVPGGSDKIAALQVTGAGVVQVSPLENS